MQYEVSADYAIVPDTTGWFTTDYSFIAEKDKTIWCLKGDCVSRFRNGRFRVITGQKFIRTLQKALESYDASTLKINSLGNVVRKEDQELLACSEGFYELISLGFVDKNTLEYTGKRVTEEYLELAFRRWAWIQYLKRQGRLG